MTGAIASSAMSRRLLVAGAAGALLGAASLSACSLGGGSHMLPKGFWGVADASGKWVLEPRFGGADGLYGGLCLASRRNSAGTGACGEELYGVVDVSTGSWRVRPRWQAVVTSMQSDVFAARDARSGLWGVAGWDGGWLAEPFLPDGPGGYAPICPFDTASGLTAAFDAASGLWGLMDRFGAWRSAPSFGYMISGGSLGLISAMDEETKLYGLVDASGSWVAPPAFSQLEPPGASGLAGAFDLETHLWGYVDTSGSWVVEPAFVQVEGSPASQLLAVLRAGDGGWGFVRPDGSWAVEPRFTDARGFDASGTRGVASEGGGYGLVDPSGEWVSRERYYVMRSFLGSDMTLARTDPEEG